MLISSPVFAHYDHELPVKLTVDSSSYALGAVLSHIYSDRSERPVAFNSWVLSDSECKFPQIENRRSCDNIWYSKVLWLSLR